MNSVRCLGAGIRNIFCSNKDPSNDADSKSAVNAGKDNFEYASILTDSDSESGNSAKNGGSSFPGHIHFEISPKSEKSSSRTSLTYTIFVKICRTLLIVLNILQKILLIRQISAGFCWLFREWEAGKDSKKEENATSENQIPNVAKHLSANKPSWADYSEKRWPEKPLDVLQHSVGHELVYSEAAAAAAAARSTDNIESDTEEKSSEAPYPTRSIRVNFYTKAPIGFEDLKSPTTAGIRMRPCRLKPSEIPRPLVSLKRKPKYLVLDLDETLIHSMVKAGKMSSGHMVEIKLSRDHAILFYVYKRPNCDEFLRMVSKWFNLIIFTASVQEYADPVLDWLELDRKLFKRRYYRQHCTLVDGIFVKDLSVIDADLSQIVIIDNSPLSYLMNEDNAIPIEGWINDPSDKHLLHLLPFLQGLRNVRDVRTILSLRLGIHDLS